MKKKMTWGIISLLMASVFVVPAAEADVVSDLLAYPPQSPSLDRQGAADAHRPGLDPAPRSMVKGPPQKAAPPRQLLIRPQGVALADRATMEETLPTPAARPQRNLSAAAAGKKNIVPRLRTATSRGPAGQARAGYRPTEAPPTRSPYQPNRTSQVSTPWPRGYGQPAQTGHYVNYPQQTSYAPTPNYYQGYAYQGWGGASQAACPPGRA